MPRTMLQPLRRNRPNTKSSAEHRASAEQRKRPKPCSTIKCNRLLRCRVATAFFVCTWLPMVADGAGIEIVVFIRNYDFVVANGRKKRPPYPLLQQNHSSPRRIRDNVRIQRPLCGTHSFVYGAGKKAEASGHKKSPFRDEQLTDALRSELITMNCCSTANVVLKFE